MPAPAFRVAKMQDVLSLLVPAELSLFLSFLLRGGGFRRRCFTQGTFRSKPVATPWVSCSYACACFSRRENARRSFAPRSCGTIAHSLIFAPRRRLPPPLLSARQFSLKTHGFCRGFLALMPAPALRVAKMQDVLSLPKKSIIHTELHRIDSNHPTYAALIPTVLTNRLFYACSHFDYKLCCLHPIILVSNNYLICLCSKEIPPLLFSLKKLAQKIDKRNKTAYHMSRSSYE